MSSIILRTAARTIHPLLLMFAIFLLLRGHDEPGGGFSGGLVAASAFVLHALAYNSKTARRAVGLNPRVLIGTGLVAAVIAGLIGLYAGGAFLTGIWVDVAIPAFGEVHLGTPLLFDLGVMLVVIGMTILIILPLVED